jgi:plasmid stabilization system protein ParE
MDNWGLCGAMARGAGILPTANARFWIFANWIIKPTPPFVFRTWHRCCDTQRRQKLQESKMPRGDKSSYSNKQKRQAEHIEESYKKRGVSSKTAAGRAWATVNKETGGAKKKTAKKSSGRKSGAKKSAKKKTATKKSAAKKSSRAKK